MLVVVGSSAKSRDLFGAPPTDGVKRVESKTNNSVSVSKVCGLTDLPLLVKKTCLFVGMEAPWATHDRSASKELMRLVSICRIRPEWPMFICSDIPSAPSSFYRSKSRVWSIPGHRQHACVHRAVGQNHGRSNTVHGPSSHIHCSRGSEGPKARLEKGTRCP